MKAENDDEPSESYKDEDESEDEDDDDDDISEMLEEGKGREEEESHGDSKRPSKRRKLDKPPTHDELNSLKETENLFHSSIFRLQIQEMMSEIQLTRTKKLDAWLQNLKEFLCRLPSLETHDLTDQQWIEDRGVTVPIIQDPFDNEGRFRFTTPKNVYILGSYPLKLVCRQRFVVDVVVEMPRTYLHAKDYLNERYHRKRAIYLACLASFLEADPQYSEGLEFSYFNEDCLKPALFINPSGKLGRKCRVRLLVQPPLDYFKTSRFVPSKNNVRLNWRLHINDKSKTTCTIPTPHYNSSILVDMNLQKYRYFLEEVMGSFVGVREGILLLKVWLHQRELDVGYGCFSSFIMSMFVAYLVGERKLNRLMSSYQVVRNTWLQLANADWSKFGISIAPTRQEGLPSLEDFHNFFEVVFVDPSGYLNLCANMSAVTFSRVRYECGRAIQILDDSNVDSFQALFMTSMPFHLTFDHFANVKFDVAWVKHVVEKYEMKDLLCGLSRSRLNAVQAKLIDVLVAGLGKRIHLMDAKLQSMPTWLLKDYPPHPDDLKKMTIGFLMNHEFFGSILDLGPSADSPEALEFRRFWGERSELRRFKDGGICEAVVWPGSTLAEKRLVCSHVIKHVLERHLSIPPSCIEYVGDQLEPLLRLPENLEQGTGEEETIKVLGVFDDLSKKLYGLKQLPLSVTSVQGISPLFRYTEVFPPNSALIWPHTSLYDVVGDHAEPTGSTNSGTLHFIKPLLVIIHLETSNKWPEDVEALRRVKAAFHIKLCQLLNSFPELTCKATPHHVDVFASGFVFRLEVGNKREVTAMKFFQTPEGITNFKDSEDSRRLERKISFLPKISSALHSIHIHNGSFSSACRLAKRWISAQLLGRHVPELCVELMVAHVFVSPAPYTVSCCPQVAFLRFLYLLSKFDWKNSPLIVNLNNELTSMVIK